MKVLKVTKLRDEAQRRSFPQVEKGGLRNNNKMNIKVKYYLLSGFIILMLTSYHLYAQNKIIKVACIGNSVTYGYGLKHSDIESYSSQLQQLLS